MLTSKLILPDLLQVHVGALLYVTYLVCLSTSFPLSSDLKEVTSFFSMLYTPPMRYSYSMINLKSEGEFLYLRMHTNRQMVFQIKPEHFASSWTPVPVGVTLADVLYPPVSLSIYVLSPGKPLGTANHWL